MIYLFTSLYLYLMLMIYIKHKDLIEYLKVWKKPKYNPWRNKCLGFDMYIF